MSDLVRELVHYFRCLTDSIRENGLEDGHQTRVFATCINKNLRLGGAEQDAIQFSTVTYNEKRDCLNENVHIAVFHPDSHHQVAFSEPDSVDRKRFPNLPPYVELKESVCKVLELWAERIEAGSPVQGCFQLGKPSVVKTPALIPSSTPFGVRIHQAFDEIWQEIVSLGSVKRKPGATVRIVIHSTFAKWVDVTQKNVALLAEERFPDEVSFDAKETWPFRFEAGFYEPDSFHYLELNCTNPVTGQSKNRKMDSVLIQESYGLVQLASHLTDCLNVWLKLDSVAEISGSEPISQSKKDEAVLAAMEAYRKTDKSLAQKQRIKLIESEIKKTGLANFSAVKARESTLKKQMGK